MLWYREAFKPSGAKDAPTDAELALDLMLRHPQRFKPLRPQSVAMRLSGHLVEQRRDLADDKKRIVNRLCVPVRRLCRRSSRHTTPPGLLSWMLERSGKKKWVHWRLAVPYVRAAEFR